MKLQTSVSGGDRLGNRLRQIRKGSRKPLIDSGALRQSITYIVED